MNISIIRTKDKVLVTSLTIDWDLPPDQILENLINSSTEIGKTDPVLTNFLHTHCEYVDSLTDLEAGILADIFKTKF